MGGGMPRATTARRTAPRSPMPHLRRTRALPSFLRPPPSFLRPPPSFLRPPPSFLRPPPSFLRPSPVIPAPLSVIPAQAGTQTLHTPALRRGYPAAPTTHSTPTPSPIQPSPLPGGRLGGGWNATSYHARRTAPRSPMPHLRRTRALPPFLHPLRHSCASLPSFLRPSPSFLRPSPSFLRPPPSFLRRQEPRPSTPPRSAAPTTHPTPTPPPIHPSPLPGGRLGGGWNATSRRRPSYRAPITHAAPPSDPRSPVILRPSPSFLRRQERRISLAQEWRSASGAGMAELWARSQGRWYSGER